MGKFRHLMWSIQRRGRAAYELSSSSVVVSPARWGIGKLLHLLSSIQGEGEGEEMGKHRNLCRPFSGAGVGVCFVTCCRRSSGGRVWVSFVVFCPPSRGWGNG